MPSITNYQTTAIVALILAVIVALFGFKDVVELVPATFEKSDRKDSGEYALAQPALSIDPVFDIVNQVRVFCNNLLIENETILAPVLSHSFTDIDKAHEEMGNLFHIQRGRADFGRWQGFISERIAKEDTPELKECLSSLELMLYILHDSLYGYAHSSTTE